MLKTAVLICALAGILTALMLTSWIRVRESGKDTQIDFSGCRTDESKHFFNSADSRLLIITVLIAVITGFGISWIGAGVYVAGVLISYIAVSAGRLTSSAAVRKAAEYSASGSISKAMRTAFRSGSAMGFYVSGAGLLAMDILLIAFNYDTASAAVSCLALGVMTAAVYFRVSGSACASAYAIAPDSDRVPDIMPLVSGLGADRMGSYVCTAAAGIALAEAAVMSSGVTSTFTKNASALYPVAVFGAGIIASIIGSLFYRGSYKKNAAGGITASNIVSAVIMIAASVFLSVHSLQSPVYAYAVIAGAVAGVAIGEITKLYSDDNFMYYRKPKGLSDEAEETHILNGVVLGFRSAVIPSIIIVGALYISYKFAGMYGAALCAAGIVSISGTSLSASIHSQVALDARQAAGLARAESDQEDLGAEVLLSTTNVISASSRGYEFISGLLPAIALIFALAYITGNTESPILGELTSAGIITGAAFMFASLSLVTGVILKITETKYDERYTASLNTSSLISFGVIIIPPVLGVVFGMDFLIGFLGSAVVTGCILGYVLENAGVDVRRCRPMTLNTIACAMVASAAAFAPFLMKFGGYFF